MTTPGTPTLLLIHGFLDDESVWDGLIEGLVGQVDTVSYDLPGFGSRSHAVAEALEATLESLADEASGLVEEIQGPGVAAGRPEPRRAGRRAVGVACGELPRTEDDGLGPTTRWPTRRQAADRRRCHIRPAPWARRRSLARRTVRAQLSPHMNEELLDRLAGIGLPVSADVTARYADMWDTGIPTAPATSAFNGRFSSSAAAQTGSSTSSSSRP